MFKDSSIKPQYLCNFINIPYYYTHIIVTYKYRKPYSYNDEY